jgi:aminoglycoside 6-adenylyltransferase
MAAKYNLDHVMKVKKLLRMLEWRLEIDQNWSLKPGAYGRGLKKYLSPDIWSKLENTYVGARIEDNWKAVFNTIALFREVAIEVGDHLGYSYPNDLDRRMMGYLNKVMELDPEAKKFLNN